jgi:hypothetical protein
VKVDFISKQFLAKVTSKIVPKRTSATRIICLKLGDFYSSYWPLQAFYMAYFGIFTINGNLFVTILASDL